MNKRRIALPAFEKYLQGTGIAARTVEEHLKDLLRFEGWMKEEGLMEAESLTYNDLLAYVQWMRKKELSVATINIRISSMRKYLDHLQEEGIIERNPARHLHIKGKIKIVTEGPLTYPELESLYLSYVAYSKEKDYHLRNVAMLGLMIWQAAHSGELVALEVAHLNLGEGRIYIPATRRGASREVSLDARQIIILYRYLETLPAGQRELFGGSTRNHVTRLMEELKGINGAIRNAQHIRASVIIYWMKLYDKRLVQYRSGHKNIGSTERYQHQEMDSLSDLLSRHHPFG